MQWILILVTCLCFANAVFHPFVHDDLVFIQQNPSIHRWDNLADVFTHTGLNQPGVNAYYRPILEIVYRFEYLLFGLNPHGYHLVNILIHLANGLLLFFLLLRMQFYRWMAFTVSLFFLIHPVQSEAVACVAGISNLLSAFFLLLLINFYLKEKYIAAFAFLGFALLTKEQTIIAPLLVMLIDWFLNRRERWKWWVGMLGVCLIFLKVRALVGDSNLLSDILQSPGELRLRLLAIPRTILTYLGLIVFPHDLHYYRCIDILKPNLLSTGILGGIVLGVMALVRHQHIHARKILFGVGWFIVCLLPVLNIVPLVNEYSLIQAAEHFLYLPMAGIVLILAILFRNITNREFHTGLFSACAIILIIACIHQNTFWRAEVPLFERVVKYEPQFGRGHLLLAYAYQKEGKKDLAYQHFSKALTVMEGYAEKSQHPTATQFYQGFIQSIKKEMGVLQI